LNIPRDSPAYTPIGRLIEQMGLTELPQLLHVVSGRMSLVGARPLPARVMEELKRIDPDAEDRFITRPGLTGPVQMIGRDRLSDVDRLSLEKEYCRLASSSRYTILLDLWLLAATVALVANPRWLMTVAYVRDRMRRLAGVPASVAVGESSAAGAD
jgi:lipopolysaccharide/colanic/teichoic acid biosynthesis glycosyltransferase